MYQSSGIFGISLLAAMDDMIVLVERGEIYIPLSPFTIRGLALRSVLDAARSCAAAAILFVQQISRRRPSFLLMREPYVRFWILARQRHVSQADHFESKIARVGKDILVKIGWVLERRPRHETLLAGV